MVLYPKNISNDRIYEIDFLRGIAIILMVIFHWYYLLDLRLNTNYTQQPLLKIIGIIARYLFILLLGVSLNLTFQNRNNNKHYNNKQLKKVFFLFVYSLLILYLISHYFQ